MTDIERNNRIDEYLIGAMPEDEKAAFEKELRENENLRSEVDAQRTIAEAVQTAHLKNMLADVEADLQRKRILRRVIIWTSSAAAAFIVIILFSYPRYCYYPDNRLRCIGNACFTELTPPVSRDGNPIDSLLNRAYSQIAVYSFSAAESSLSEARSLINKDLKTPAADEESRYRHALLRQHLYEVDWLEAITLMKQGRDRKARRLLESIADSQSPYSGKAREILNLYYLDK